MLPVELDKKTETVYKILREKYEEDVIAALTNPDWDSPEARKRLRLFRKLFSVTDKQLKEKTAFIIKARDRYVELLRLWKPSPTEDFAVDVNKIEKELLEAGAILSKTVENVYQDWQQIDAVRQQIVKAETDFITETNRTLELGASPRFRLDYDIRREHKSALEKADTLRMELVKLENDLKLNICQFRGMSVDELLSLTDGKEKE
jgi:ribosomal protein S16